MIGGVPRASREARELAVGVGSVEAIVPRWRGTDQLIGVDLTKVEERNERVNMSTSCMFCMKGSGEIDNS